MAPRLISPVLLLLIMAAAVGCQQPRPYPVTPAYNYVIPTITYLRECPGYECATVAEVFSGDRVLVLDRNDFGWSRVQLDRTGAIGWIFGDLLSYTPVPATFYITLASVYLRSCADYNCSNVELLRRNDRVEKIDQDYRGWWRVRSFRSGKSGWIPAAAVGIKPGTPYYYVNVESLAMRSGPSTSNRVLTTLGLNRQVEMLGSGTGGWVQVRDLKTNTIGWVAGRYVESFPVSQPRPVPKRPGPPKKPGKEPEEAPKAPVPPPPKVM